MTDRNEHPDFMFEMWNDPEKHGYEQCTHCNGYGSSLKDPEGVGICTKCGGSGLTKMKEISK